MEFVLELLILDACVLDVTGFCCCGAVVVVDVTGCCCCGAGGAVIVIVLPLKFDSLVIEVLTFCKLDIAGCVELFVMGSFRPLVLSVGLEDDDDDETTLALMACFVVGSTINNGFLSRFGAGGGTTGCMAYGL